MLSIMIDMVDDKLRARHVPQPNAKPDFTYDMDEDTIGVWLQPDLDANDPGLLEELDNLVWVTVMTLPE